MHRIHPFRNRYWAAAFVLAAAALLLSGSFLLLSWITKAGQAAPPSPRQAVEQAWHRARKLGSYKFITNLEASTSPLGQPVPENSARYERLYLEGQVDLPAHKMELTMWEKGGKMLNTRQGIQVRVEEGKTYGRVGSGAWQEMEGATDAFAPGQDPMAFLAGAKDFYLAGTGSVEVPSPEGTTQAFYTRYGFDVDGIEFATNLRSKLEKQMAESGELPPGVTLDIAEAFRGLSGQGEIWINEAGLPLRLIVDLEYPEQYGEQSRSHIKTDFSDFPDKGAAAHSIFNQPLSWARQTLNLPALIKGWDDFGLHATLLLVCLALALIVVRHSRSRAVYITCVVVTILSMLVSPLWQSQKVLAFNERIQEQRREAEAQQALQIAQTSTDWDPLQDPLAASAAPAIQIGLDPLVEGAAPAIQSALEAPAQPLLTFGGTQATSLGDATEPDPNSDVDGDGLTYQEEMRLGTDPTLLNSDLDGLGDGLEAMGFDYTDPKTGLTDHYYTDPLVSDTSNDGLLDTLECWNTAPTPLPNNSTGCDLDSDQDGQLDIREQDNDNDGVADAVDLSPFSALSGFSAASPFQMIINKLQPEPVLVDLQIRPTNPEHLAYTMSVMDWPTGDTQGQVQRVLGNTFATAVDDPLTPEEIASDPRVQYGDMRLIPMLEISVPYKEGHTRNLPVKPGFTGSLSQTTPLDQWLDQSKLDKYGMAAHYLDETGRLAIYAPLNLVEDETGGSYVAFRARLYYEPQANGDWGHAQEIRLVWWVQVLTDQCDSSAYDENTDGEFEAWCAQPQNRIESPQIVYTYPEHWSLTGLSVREDHGLETIVAFEDPNFDANVNDDDYLWKLTTGMDGAYMSARDCDPVGLSGECLGDGRRDITLDDIERRFDNRYNIEIPADDPILWNIPKTALQVWKNEYPQQDFMISMVTTTTKQILEDKFLPVSGCKVNCTTPRATAPTLLYATEEHARTANLDMGGTTMSGNGNPLTVDMDPANVTLDTFATMSWSPFRYREGAWEAYPLEEYLALFDERLDAYFPIDPTDPDSEDLTHIQKTIAASYYLGMTQGTTATMESGGSVNTSATAIEDVEIVTVNIVEAIYRTVDTISGLLEISTKGLWTKTDFGVLSDPVDIIPSLDENAEGSIIPEPKFTKRYTSSFAERLCAGGKVGVSIIMGLVAVTFMVLSLTIEDAPALPYIQGGLMAAGSMILLSLSTLNLIKTVRSGEFKNIRSGWRDTTKTRGFKLALVGLAIDIAAQMALFLYTMITTGSEMSGWEIGAYVTYFVITVAVTVILFALYLIPVIGDIIYAIVSLLNAVFSIICAALGDDFKESKGGVICKGVAGILGAILFKVFYSVQTLPYVPEEEEEDDDSGGLTQSSPDVNMVDPDEGFKQGAQLSYTFNLTRTIRLTSYDELDNWKARQWSSQFNEKNLKKSTFDYLLTGQEEDAHQDLYLGKEKNWVSLGLRNDVPWVEIRRPLSNQQYFTLASAGINQGFATYYTEGYDMPLQECWGWPPISGCGLTSMADSGHTEIGQYFLYDVFPANLDSFRTLQAVKGGYRLAWGAFPVLKDADGDGLAASSDPNDNTWDTDKDGLSDVYELQYGTNPSNADSDNDTLSDREEVINGSNPNKPDSDFDSLTDAMEKAGWDFLYGWNTDPVTGDRTPKIIHISSNPCMVDSDFDGLSDYKEWLYGWNPLVPSEGDVLTFSSDLSERDASGQYSITDGVVRHGDQLRYEAKVKNELDLRYMRGLLSTQYPAGSLSGSVDPRTFVLAPREPATIQGDLSITASSSGPLTLTQIAGAELYNAQAATNYAELLLHLEDPAGATVFQDEAGAYERRNGTCLPGECPTSQVPGARGMGVRFTQPGQKISVDAVDVSRGSLGVTMWISTINFTQSLFISQDSAVKLTINSEGAPCAEVQTNPARGQFCSGTPINNGQWHQLAFSYDASTTPNVLSLYVDGNLVNTINATARMAYTSDMSGVDLGVNYVGDMDEITVYSRALSQSEIQAANLYNSASPIARLDEPVNSMAFLDASGLGRGYCFTGTCPRMGTFGVSRTAAEFDGLDDFIEFATNQSLYFPTNQDFTVSLWANVAAQNDMTLIMKGIGSWPYPFQISYIASTHSIRAKRQDSTNHIPTINASVAIDDGQFHHIAFIRQAGRLYLYIDGAAVGNIADTCTSDTNNGYDLFIGRAGYNEKYFKGRIDEVRIYRRGLSQAEVQQLVEDYQVPLDLHFDEAPGSYQFQDSNGLQPAVCSASLVGCPTSGVPGRRHQAVEFDGFDDFLDASASPAVSGTSALTVGAWVRTTATRNQMIVNQRSAAVYNGEYTLSLTAQGKVYWFTYGNSGAAGFSLQSVRAVNDGKWHHVAATRDQNGSAFIYIDGSLDATLTNTDPTKIAPLVATNVYIGADVRDHSGYFDGAIDELQIRRYALSAAAIGVLISWPPRFQLHLEEAAGTNSFTIDTELGHVASCTGAICPKAGVNGQIGLAAEFDGVDDGISTNYSIADHYATIMVWVRPNSTIPGEVISGDPLPNFPNIPGFELYHWDGLWKVNAGLGTIEPAEAKVQIGEWQHLAVRISGSSYKYHVELYRNGVLMPGAKDVTTYKLNNTSIGYYRWNPTASSFDGRIDEVTIYDYALSPSDIMAIFDYQAGWVEQVKNTELIVDNEPPSVKINLPGTVIADQPIQLRIETSDATSSVNAVQWRYNGGSWYSAPACQGVDYADAWCPTLTPSGAGSYTIEATATDRAGNSSTTASATLLVDNTAPTATLAQEGALVQLQASATKPYGWMAALSGNVSDSSPSSGVAAVRVALIDPQGVPMAGDSQLATISGGSWNINYQLTEPLISGLYTVQLETDDNVGNHRIDRLHNIFVDQSAPEAAFDGPPPGGALALWRLEDPGGATRFADSSGLGNEAICDLSCPVAGVTGKYGNGIQLSAGQSLKTSRSLTVGDTGFALSTWFQTGASSQQTLFAVTDSSGANFATVKLSAGGYVVYNLAPPGQTAIQIVSSSMYKDNAWHHLSAQWQPGQIQLFMDGQLVRTIDGVSGSLPPSVNVIVGHHAGLDPFNGKVDEIVIQGVYLTPSEVRSLAFTDPTKKQSEYVLKGTISELGTIRGAMLSLHLEEATSPFMDSSDYNNDAFCKGAFCPTVDGTGRHGKSLRFDGIDDGLTIYTSSLHHLSNNLTLMAWIKPERLTGVQWVMDHAQCATGGGFGFGLNGSGLILSAYGDRNYYSSGVNLASNQWQHIAVSIAADNSVTFYVNGLAQGTQAGSGLEATCPTNIEIGRSMTSSGAAENWFQGSIDEVQVFNRVLTPEEFLAMGQQQNAGIKSLEVAYTSDLSGSTRYNSQVLPGTQLYLPLDDTEDAQGNLTFLDISGLGFNGSCSDPGCPAVGQAGHAGTSAMFDGNDSVYVKPGSGWTDYMTISTWIYPVGSTAYRGTFISRHGRWQISCLTDGTIRMSFRDTALGAVFVYPGYKAPLNQWTHLVVVYDAGVFRTYANGKHVGNDITTTGSIYNGAALYIGAWPPLGEYFGGGLDEVLIINDALTDAEVQSLYLGSEPVVHLPLDESWVVDGSEVADTSGWRRFGTLTSGTSDAANKATAGQVGLGAIHLDGTDDYISLGNVNEANELGDFTISQWFSIDSLSPSSVGWAAPVGKGVWNGTDGWAVLVNNYSGNSADHRINLYLNGAVVATIPAPATGWQTGTWYHYAFTRTGSTIMGYLDGTEQAASDSSIVPRTNNAPVLLGKNQSEQYFFPGKLDDLQIFRRGISAGEVHALYDMRWRSATLSASGSTVMQTNWQTTIPGNLEGHYRVDFRSMDNFGNHTERRSAWDGVLDTTAPRATLTYEGGPTTYTLRFYAQDITLDETKLQTPCPASTTLNKTFFNPPWFRALTGVTTPDSSRLYSLDGTCQVTLADPTQASLTACDQYGNCAAVKATAATTAAFAAAKKPAPPTGQVLILTPAPGAIVNNLQPLSISGTAQADNYLKRLTVSVDGKKVLNLKWDKRSMQAYDWSAAWLPTKAGTHLIEAELTDWKNAEVTHSVRFILDTAAPNLAIETTVLTTTHVVNSQLPIRGTASDENGIALVEVQVEAQGYTSGWTPATLEGDAWLALVYPGHDFQPDNEVLTVRARASDRSGRMTIVRGSLTADLQPPAPSDLAITYDDISGTYPITQTGAILTGDAPTLHLRWSASSDGAGLSGYRAGWIIRDSNGIVDTTADFSPTDNRLASYQAGEAQQLTAGVVSIDQYGNQQSQAFGPIYVDSPLTPDYIELDDTGNTYHGWMEGGCSLLGQDRRVNEKQPDNATRGQNQALYATWDSQALRLAWTGANWSGDGDLFVYLDTTAGGTLDAMNPYTSTVVTLQLPGVLPVGPRPNAMYADYIVWVQDDQAAWLYRWDGAAWVASSQLESDRYRFEPGLNSGTTDLYLPFELLGIDNPESTPLKLVAFATEEGSLQLWAVLPQSNPVTSPFVTGRPRAEQVYVQFALNHPFSWDGLGSGACPNGSQALLPDQRQYTDDDLKLSVTADPVGASYRYLGDHLFGWWLTLLQDKPAEFSSMLATIVNEFQRVQDGQEISYTIHYKNDGAQAAQDVMLQVRSRLALILPDGAPQATDDHVYYQEVYLGDVAPGQSGSVSVRGRVDLAWGEQAYQDCLAQHPNRPLACMFAKRWALLGVQVFDQAHTPIDGPRELMWVDHRVDSEAPLFAGIANTAYGLSALANNTLRGYAYDESGVESVKLEIVAPDGTTTQMDCNDPTPLDGKWDCGLNLETAAQDGDVYRLRLQARDGVGFESDWSTWQTFVVDRTAADVTVDSVPTYTVNSPPVSLNQLNLGGLVEDNVGVRGVEVCQGSRCEAALTQFSTREWSYPDVLSSPLAIGDCSSGMLERTFTIPEDHTVGEIRLGFRAEIANRDRLVVTLTSPSGMSWQVVGDDYDLSTNYGNLNVILSDRVAAGLSALRASQALTAGGFGALVRPLQPLAIFRGQQAAGTWKLSVCQEDSAGLPALYYGSELWVEPPNTAPLSGNWQTTLPLGKLDDVEQTVLVYGIDEAGNRSPVPQALTFRIDNVTPVMTVMQVNPLLTILPDLATQTVLAGSVSDGGQVVRMHAYVRDPEGIGESLRPIVNADLTWQVQIQPMKVGAHQVWVAAEDEAGNLTTAGPFSVEVLGIPENVMSAIPPEATVTPTATITVTLTLTPSMILTPTVTISPTLTSTPQPTETPTPPPPPTETPMPPPTETPTPTLTITTTLELMPGVVTLPLLAPAPIWLMKPTPIPTVFWSWFR